MAIKKIYIGSIGPLEYDDSEDINDPDGDFAGQKQAGLVTSGNIVGVYTPTGYSGTLWVLVGIRYNGATLQYMIRPITFTNGILTSEGTPSSWTDVPTV